MVTDEQVRLLRRKVSEGKSQESAAAAAGMSVRSARKWSQGALPSESRSPRSWRTRKDPFADVWEEEVVPLLKADDTRSLEATTVLDELMTRHPKRFTGGQVRTLQRRIRDWRAMHGPEKEVYFEQVHPPGREGAADFTHATKLGVTISGELLRHLFFVFRLSFSKWMWIEIAFGETYEALVSGVQGALWELGGVPSDLRTDNLSAATHELRRSGGRSLTIRFRSVLEHYGMRSSRIRPGKSHENGGVEKAHDLLKSWLNQALIVRGSREFPSIEVYLEFARDVLERRHNRGCATRLEEERRHLSSLPSARVPSYTTSRPTVRRWSTVRVGSRTYSVPSRLIGHQVEARLHPDFVEVFYKERVVERMPRLRGDVDHRIDYRHVSASLVRKPGAFARYRYREDLFPTMTFRRAYDALCATHGSRADIEYVRVLDLAAKTMESQVEHALQSLLEGEESFDYAAVRELAAPADPVIPEIRVGRPDLGAYDQLVTEIAR